MVSLLYSNPANPIGAAALSALVGLLIVIGEIVGGLIAKRIMFIKWQIVTTIGLGGLFFACENILTAYLRTRLIKGSGCDMWSK